MRTLAILPVKSFPRAKERLSQGLSADLRRTLAEAMFADVLGALTRVDAIAEILVVTAGDTARGIAEGRGARVVKDRELGHNAAAALGIEAALKTGAERVLLVPGDCPALDPEQLDALLAQQLAPPSAVIVPDRHQTGTNALLLAPPNAIDTAFGPNSCERHLQIAASAGIEAEVIDVPSLAIDIDTPDDLDALEGLAAPDAATRTRELLTTLTQRC
jgi:2-phospho-L-lactate/phosphoenolpyruvate guanylyltransferase